MDYEKWYYDTLKARDDAYARYCETDSEEDRETWVKLYEEFKHACLIILRVLMQENSDILHNLKN